MADGGGVDVARMRSDGNVPHSRPVVGCFSVGLLGQSPRKYLLEAPKVVEYLAGRWDEPMTHGI